MMKDKRRIYVEQDAVEAVMWAVRLLEESGDECGALRELEHFISGLKEKVMMPLDELVLEESRARDGFPWLVKSRLDMYRLFTGAIEEN